MLKGTGYTLHYSLINYILTRCFPHPLFLQMNRGEQVIFHPPVVPTHVLPVVRRRPPLHLAVAIEPPEVELAQRHIEREPLDVVLALRAGQRGFQIRDLRSGFGVEIVVGDVLRAGAHLLQHVDFLLELKLEHRPHVHFSISLSPQRLVSCEALRAVFWFWLFESLWS